MQKNQWLSDGLTRPGPGIDLEACRVAQSVRYPQLSRRHPQRTREYLINAGRLACLLTMEEAIVPEFRDRLVSVEVEVELWIRQVGEQLPLWRLQWEVG